MRRFPLLAVIALLAVALGAAGCSGGDDRADGPEPTTRTTVELRRANLGVKLRLSGLEVVTAAGRGAAPKLSGPSRVAILDTLQTYVDRATVTPLTTARKAVDVNPLFSVAARPAVARRDRPKLVDEGLPKVVLRPTSYGKVRLTVLMGRDGRPAVATARLDLKVSGDTGDGRKVAIARKGEVTLVRAGKRWAIESYALKVAREVKPTAAAEAAG